MLRDGQKHELDKQHLPSSFSNKSRMESFSDGCWLMQHLYFDLLLSPVLFLLNRNMCAQTMKPSLHKFPSSCFKSINWTLLAVCLFACLPVLFVSIFLTWHCMCCVCADREAVGVGAFSVTQRTQEDGVLSAGSTGHRHWEETCKITSFLLITHFIHQLDFVETHDSEHAFIVWAFVNLFILTYHHRM